MTELAISSSLTQLTLHTDAFECDWGSIRAPLIICDPWYGDIVGKKDVATYEKWFALCTHLAMPDATVCLWGGIGKPRHRPLIEFAAAFEHFWSGWAIEDWITWSKKRAYGKPRNYLFTREELLIIRRGKPTFNVPLLDVKRGYPGYNKKYPAKSEFKRRTTVWTDITEILRGKLHECQKPDKLYEILVETHSNAGDLVIDPCCGSGTTGRAATKLGRAFIQCDRDREALVASGWEIAP